MRLVTFLFLAFAVTVNAATVPSLILKNQQGEVSKNFVIGGTSQISAKFVVDNTQASGVRSLTTYGGANAPAAVYMNTTITPSAGNPNPSPGYVVVKFAKGYTQYIMNSSAIGSPASGSLVNVTSGLQRGSPYVIAAVGTTTAAQWQALGLPSNITPTPSQSFVATTGAPGVGTGTVELANASGSGVYKLEFVGSPTLNANTTDGTGGQFIYQILGPTNSSTTTLVAKAPAQNSVLELNFSMAPQPGSPL